MVIKKRFERISDTGCGQVKFGDSVIEIDSYDYYWTKDDEIVEGKIVVDTTTYYINTDDEGNEYLKLEVVN